MGKVERMLDMGMGRGALRKGEDRKDRRTSDMGKGRGRLLWKA